MRKSRKSNAIIAAVVIAVVVLFVIILVYVASTRSKQIVLELENLEPLAQGHFEVWAIYGNEKLSVGKFNVGDSLVFSSKKDLSSADQIAVTIEPEGDEDNIPSGVVILSGEVVNRKITLSPPFNFDTVQGSYILATPTDGPDTNEKSGIWFLKLPEPPTASLKLPILPEGWKYEGWVVHQGIPITSGRFLFPEGADNFDGYSMAQPAPPFPGEDYLINGPIDFPINLADGKSKAVISVEPDIDNIDPTGKAPFQIKPLIGDIPINAQDHLNYNMKLNLGTLPSGSGSIL